MSASCEKDDISGHTKKEQDVLQSLDNHTIDQAITNMQNEIQSDIASSCPLVKDLEDINSLVQEYSVDDVQYQNKIKALTESYSHIRRTRGDGNCFFRAFGFRYLEYLMKNPKDFSGFKELASQSFQNLMKLKYPSFTVEDFFDNFISVVDSAGTDMTPTKLLETFCDDGMSNYIIVYLRLIASCQLQMESEFYQNFVDNGKTVVEFCKTEVEPMYHESDHIHITALTSALNAKIRVVYMNHGDDKLSNISFPESCEPNIHLLYRPGHYDILYPK